MITEGTQQVLTVLYPLYKDEVYKRREQMMRLTAFGAFVDVGVKRDGLVHVSRLSRSFVRDPSSGTARSEALPTTGASLTGMTSTSTSAVRINPSGPSAAYPYPWKTSTVTAYASPVRRSVPFPWRSGSRPTRGASSAPPASGAGASWCDRESMIEHWEEHSGRRAPELRYYSALSGFRLAVLLEGVYQRSLADPTRGSAEPIGAMVLEIAKQARATIDA